MTSVTSSVSDPSQKKSALPQNDAKQSEPPKNNRVNGEDLQNPNFDEAIAAIIDENGGVHLNDGPGSLFSLVGQAAGEEVDIFVKPISSEVKQNIRRGLTPNKIVLINRTQLALTEGTNTRSNSRYQPTQRQTPQLSSQYIQHQVPQLRDNRESGSRQPLQESQPQQQRLDSQRTNTRTPRQRIHIIVNNRTQVQEIPIDDPIDFQRIPAIQQTATQVNRYSNSRTIDHNRRPLPPVNNTRPIRTTTPSPIRREPPTERPQERRQILSDRRPNPRTIAPTLLDYDSPPELPYVRRDTIPQRPSPIYRTPEPFSTAQACNQKACRLPDCLCAGSDIPGNKELDQLKFLHTCPLHRGTACQSSATNSINNVRRRRQ